MFLLIPIYYWQLASIWLSRFFFGGVGSGLKLQHASWNNRANFEGCPGNSSPLSWSGFHHVSTVSSHQHGFTIWFKGIPSNLMTCNPCNGFTMIYHHLKVYHVTIHWSQVIWFVDWGFTCATRTCFCGQQVGRCSRYLPSIDSGRGCCVWIHRNGGCHISTYDDI